jgi:hypothetical protein
MKTHSLKIQHMCQDEFRLEACVIDIVCSEVLCRLV